MTLADRLAAPGPGPDARRARESHPRGFEPGVRYEAGEASEVTLVVNDISGDEQAWREKITAVTGLTVPNHRQVQLTDVRYWGDPASPFIYAKFQIVNRVAVGVLDVVGTLKALRKNRKAVTPTFDGQAAFCIDWADWQMGKTAGGGSAATVERIDGAIESAISRAKELRTINRDLGELVIVGGGDLVEGCFIFPHQAFEIDMDRRSQINAVTAVILDGIDRLAPHFSRVTVLAIGGNHAEHRVNGNRVNRFDNDDCLVFENAARATERDPRLSHVNYVIAQDERAKTLNVNGWILGTTHGDVFGKTSGSTAEVKARQWFAAQAAGRQPVGDSDLLVTHHFHHYFARDWGSCMWVQSPAMDGGSPFYTDFSGQYAEPGMLSWVMHPGSRYTDSVIL